MSADRLEELRALILRPDQDRLERLGARIESPEQRAEDVAAVLPDSISASYATDSRLIGALSRPIKQCISESVRDEPDEYAAALFPVMGPAIRRSITETLRTWTQQFSEVIELSLSPKGLRWRVEAWRAGVPFGQYVIQKTLVYRVEHVYLIHSATGLLLSHVTQATGPQQDEDAVSAMFTAIQSFVNDSFSQGNRERLTTADLGEVTLWAVHGPHSTIVAVIRGVAPIELRMRLETAIERIERDKGQALADYGGDRESMSDVDPILTSCLLTAMRDNQLARRRPLAAYAIAAIVVVALAAWWLRNVWLDASADDAAAALAAAPGIVVTDIERRGSTLTVRGLRDRLAAQPSDILADAGWTGAIAADFRPFLSLDDTLVTARAVATLAPPPGVELTVTEGTLTIAGLAATEWIETALTAAPGIAGIDRIDTSALTIDPDSLLALASQRLEPPATIALTLADNDVIATGTASQAWLDAAAAAGLPPPLGSLDLSAVGVLEIEEMSVLAGRIDTVEFRFDRGAVTPAAESLAAIGQTAEIILAYGELAGRVGATPTVMLTGFSDESGAEAANRALEIRRASAVAASLTEAGVPAGWIGVQGHLEAGVPGSREPLVAVTIGRQDAGAAPD